MQFLLQIKEQWILSPGILGILTMKQLLLSKILLEDLQRPVLLGDISLDRRNQSWLSLRLVSPKRQSQLLGGELSVNLYRRMIPHIG